VVEDLYGRDADGEGRDGRRAVELAGGRGELRSQDRPGRVTVAAVQVHTVQARGTAGQHERPHDGAVAPGGHV
jgi:hypothetical protein